MNNRLSFIAFVVLMAILPLKSYASAEFGTIQELLDGNYKNPTDVTINNLTVIDQIKNYTSRYLLMDREGKVIYLLNQSEGNFSIGESFNSIACNFQPNYDFSTLGWLYLTDEGRIEKNLTIKDSLFPIIKILTGSQADNPVNNDYVRIEATMTDVYYDLNLNAQSHVGYNITPNNIETEYIVFNPRIHELKLSSGKKYVFYGQIDNSLRNAFYGSPKTQRNVIYISNAYEVTDEGDNAFERRIGVYSENSEMGNCYVSESGISADEDGIVWETVKDGSEVTLHALANQGYEFKCWTFNGKEVSTDSEYKVRVYGDALYCAVFEQAKIIESKITITVPEGAKIILNSTSYSESQSIPLTEGSSATIEAVAPDGYVFDYWENGNQERVSADNPYTFTVEGDISLNPIFKEETKYVSIAAKSSNSEHGKVLINSFPETPRKFIVGEEVIIEAIAENGFRFTHWDLGNGQTTDKNPYTFSAESDLEVTAYFAKAEWTLTFKAGGNGSMTVTDADGKELTSGAKVEDGTGIIVTLLPDSRYKVDELFVKRGESEEVSVPVANDRYTTVINSDTEIKATFKVDINGYYDLKVSIEEQTDGEILGEAYIDEPGTTSVTAKYMENHTFYAVPNSFSKFTGWRSADSDVIRSAGTEKDGVYTLEWNGASDENLVAVFDYKMVFPRTVTVKVNNPDKGMVAIVGERGHRVESRKPVTVKATPLTEYDHFRNWTDSNGTIVSTEPEFTYKDEADIELTANFYSLYPVILENEGLSRTILLNEDGEEIESGATLSDGAVINVLGFADESEMLEFVTVNNEPIDVELTDEGFETSVTLNRPLTIKVTWEPKLYSLSIESNEGGDIHIYSEISSDGKPFGSELMHGQKVTHGSTIHIFILPEEGHQLETLNINGKDVTNNLIDGYINHTAFDHISIMGSFKAIPSAIELPQSDSKDTTITIFDLYGRQMKDSLDSLRPGIYIVREGDSVRKIRID